MKSIAGRPGASGLGLDRATARSVSGRRLTRPRLSLLQQFMLANCAICLVAALILGAWVGKQIERGVMARTATITALYVDSVLKPLLQPLPKDGVLDPGDIEMLDRLVAGTLARERIVAAKVWSLDGRILYSPDARLIGRTFPVDEGLAHAVDGEVTAELSDLTEEENVYERERWHTLLQVYAPVREDRTGEIVAVAEFYQLPEELDAEISAARSRSWAGVAVLALAVYVLLVGIVKRGSDTIARQQAALRGQVRELAHLLEQNGHLHERVRQAAVRTTTLNEQSLRRISADLHDGPGQALALALLRLDAARALGGEATSPDFETVQGSVREALREIRAISRGLRLPELQPLSVEEVAERAVGDHERQTGTAVCLRIDSAPDQVGLAVKIALHRTLQEALSNATRHAGGREVEVRLRTVQDWLELVVSDRGPGFDPAAANRGGLGLAGMRERAEMLGGTFELRSAPGHGTSIEARWPLLGQDRT